MAQKAFDINLGSGQWRLVRLFPDRAVRVRTLTGDTVLCSWARHFTLTVPLSTQEYKWVPANCWGNLTNCEGVTCDGLASRPGGVEILLAASCYGNRDKLRPDEPVGSIRLHYSHDWESDSGENTPHSKAFIQFSTDESPGEIKFEIQYYGSHYNQSGLDLLFYSRVPAKENIMILMIIFI